MEQEEGNKEHFCTIHLCTQQRRGTEKGKIQAQNSTMRRREKEQERKPRVHERGTGAKGTKQTRKREKETGTKMVSSLAREA